MTVRLLITSWIEAVQILIAEFSDRGDDIREFLREVDKPCDCGDDTCKHDNWWNECTAGEINWMFIHYSDNVRPGLIAEAQETD